MDVFHAEMSILTSTLYSTNILMATHGELIELLYFAESKCEKHNDIELSELLVTLFKERHPSIYIGRPRRFLDTVRRIAAPTRPSMIGESKIDGDCLRAYMKKTWKPKIRNPAPTGMLFHSV